MEYRGADDFEFSGVIGEIVPCGVSTEISFKVIDENCRNGYATKWIANIRKKVVKPKALFTTLDGKEIFHGDQYYWICEDDEISCFGADKDWTGGKDGGFSTREAAEEWLLLNKPLLSVNDVIGLDLKIDVAISQSDLERNGLTINGYDIVLFPDKSLKELAKQKLSK